MNIRIQSLDFTAQPELETFVQKKIEKLGHLNTRIINAEVTMRLEKSSTRDNKICEIRLVVPGSDLFAKRRAASFEEAATLVTSALHQQIEKEKTQMLNKQGHPEKGSSTTLSGME